MVESNHVELKMATQTAFTCSLDTQLSIPGVTSDVKCLLTTSENSWLLMINMFILMKCTVNCTGTLLTKLGGCAAY